MRKRHYTALLLMAIATGQVLVGQTQVDLRTQSKSVDFSQAISTRPVKSGTTLPGTCLTGELFFKSDAAAGSNLFACTSTDTWTLQSGGGSGGGSVLSGAGDPSGSCTAGSIYSDTLNQATWFCEGPMLWRRVMTSEGAGPFVLEGEAGSIPIPPAVGSTAFFFSATGEVGQSVDSMGGLATMVRPVNCFSNGQVLRGITSDGDAQCGGGVISQSFPGGAGTSAAPQPGSWWMDGSTTVVCPTGTPYHCHLNWSSGGDQLSLTTSVPVSWSGDSVAVTIQFQGDGAGNTVQAAVESGCVGQGASGVSFHAAQNFPSQATSGNNYYLGTVSTLDMTGCLAGEMLVLRFSRADSAGAMRLAGADITFNVQ